MQFVERAAWIPAFHIHYHLGVDGISMPLILLTTLMTVLVVLAGWEVIQYRPAQYMAAFLIQEGLMVGAFSALDSILFYVFWEALLIPMFLVIGIWGGPRRIYATVKFFLYTFLGSVLMLVALLYLYSEAGSFAVLDLHALPLGLTAQKLVFVAFLAAYTLWMYKRVVYGPVANEEVGSLEDVGRREFVVLAVLVLLLGLWPAPLLEVMGPSVEHLGRSKL